MPGGAAESEAELDTLVEEDDAGDEVAGSQNERQGLYRLDADQAGQDIEYVVDGGSRRGGEIQKVQT